MELEHKHLSALTKILLIGAEVLFVGILFLMRLGIAGWLLIIFGVLLILWAFVHLGLMTAFITVLRSSKIDIALYLAVHFFYLGAWLFQTDAGDNRVTWTIRLLPYTDFLDPFLKEWGGVLFLVTSIATLVCYLLILILVVIRLVRF